MFIKYNVETKQITRSRRISQYESICELRLALFYPRFLWSLKNNVLWSIKLDVWRRYVAMRLHFIKCRNTLNVPPRFYILVRYAKVVVCRSVTAFPREKIEKKICDKCFIITDWQNWLMKYSFWRSIFGHNSSIRDVTARQILVTKFP